MLYFPPQKAVLLISEREADAILGRILDSRRHSHFQIEFSFIHLTSAKRMLAIDEGTAAPSTSWLSTLNIFNRSLSVQSKESINIFPEPDVIAMLQLFNGETSYETNQQKTALALMLPAADAKKAALCFPVYRGVSHRIARSDLEIVCTS